MLLTDNDIRSDAELLECYRTERRPEHFATLYLRYTERVYGLALRYLGNRADAEDAVMQLFEELSDKVLRHEIACFRTWLYSVARNHCLMRLRRAGRHRPAPSVHDPADDATVELLADREARERRLEALTACLEQLPEPQRRSIRLFFFDDLSYADIAAATSWHLKSVKSYIQNGKRNLRLCLENRKR